MKAVRSLWKVMEPYGSLNKQMEPYFIRNSKESYEGQNSQFEKEGHTDTQTDRHTDIPLY